MSLNLYSICNALLYLFLRSHLHFSEPCYQALALVTLSLRVCHFGVQSRISLRKNRNQTLYSNTLSATSGCVSTEFVKDIKENEYSLLEKYYMHMNTVHTKEQAGTTKFVCLFCSVCVCSCNVVSCAEPYWRCQGSRLSCLSFLSGRPPEPPCVSTAISGSSLPFMCGGPDRLSPISPISTTTTTTTTHTWDTHTHSGVPSQWHPTGFQRGNQSLFSTIQQHAQVHSLWNRWADTHTRIYTHTNTSQAYFCTEIAAHVQFILTRIAPCGPKIWATFLQNDDAMCNLLV